MSKIDIDKLVASQYKRELQRLPTGIWSTYLDDLDSFLQEQRLCYKDGEIVEIEPKKEEKVEPLFALGEVIEHKSSGILWLVTDISNGFYMLRSIGKYTLRVDFNSQDSYRLKARAASGWDTVKAIEPKFKVGGWIVNNRSKDIFLIKNINSGYCSLEDTKGNIYSPCLPFESDFHLWTIQDAKDGDVLYHKAENGIEYIVMNKGLNEHNNIDSYFRYSSINGFGIDIPSVLSAKFDSITPATKEQRDLLFQKMNEAGFEWDAEKKELKKIKQKPVWSEEDENMLNNCIAAIVHPDCFSYSFRDEAEVWLKSLKGRMQKGK